MINPIKKSKSQCGLWDYHKRLQLTTGNIRIVEYSCRFCQYQLIKKILAAIHSMILKYLVFEQFNIYEYKMKHFMFKYHKICINFVKIISVIIFISSAGEELLFLLVPVDFFKDWVKINQKTQLRRIQLDDIFLSAGTYFTYFVHKPENTDCLHPAEKHLHSGPLTDFYKNTTTSSLEVIPQCSLPTNYFAQGGSNLYYFFFCVCFLKSF